MRRLAPRGFTMIDVMLAIAIVTILGAAITPMVNGYLTRGNLSSTTRDIIAAARYAQAQSQAGVDNTTWGIYVNSGNITVYRGASYAARTATYDQNVSYPSGTVVTGTAEYVFARRTGRTTGGTLTLTSPSLLTQVITVNSVGMVDY